MGQLGGQRRLDSRPGQPRGQHRQRVAQVDHVVQAGAEKSGVDMRQIPQESGPWRIKFNRSSEQESHRKLSIHVGCRRIAGPTNYCMFNLTTNFVVNGPKSGDADIRMFFSESTAEAGYRLTLQPPSFSSPLST